MTKRHPKACSLICITLLTTTSDAKGMDPNQDTQPQRTSRPMYKFDPSFPKSGDGRHFWMIFCHRTSHGHMKVLQIHETSDSLSAPNESGFASSRLFIGKEAVACTALLLRRKQSIAPVLPSPFRYFGSLWEWQNCVPVLLWICARKCRVPRRGLKKRLRKQLNIGRLLAV